jgi:4-amino-4-deoxychorismate lyase
MSRLVETIRIENGTPLNISFHNERMNRSRYDLFRMSNPLDLSEKLSVAPEAGEGIFKCRVEYDTEIRKIEFVPYKIRAVGSLKLIESTDISYSYKFTDRKVIDQLFAARGEADDILIIKNGMVTDTSYANIVLIDNEGAVVTPSTCLLAGTRRASLLQSGLIAEQQVRVEDLKKYTLLKIINAMIGLEDTEGILVSDLL